MEPAERQSHFDSWTSEHASILRRTAQAFARGADRDDLMQELLLAVWRAVPAFRRDAAVATFLYRVTHNAALTWYRGQRNRRDREETVRVELGRSSGALPPTTPLDDDGTVEARRLALLYDAIHRLAPLDRSLVLLSLDGVPYAEIGALHGLSESNVGARLTRARKALTDQLLGDSR